MRTTSNASASHAGSGRRQRPAPQRTCVGCRRTGDQSSFVRVVRQGDSVNVDDAQRRAPGRGAYLCRDAQCWTRGVRGALAHALRTTISESDRHALEAYGARFAHDTGGSEGDAATTETTPADGAGSDEPTAPRAATAAEKERAV